jgi:5'-deoxynucleotidase YfbR-like HD superfamily hydrolase
MLHVLKMIIIHDINEAYVGDVPAFVPWHAQQAK